MKDNVKNALDLGIAVNALLEMARDSNNTELRACLMRATISVLERQLNMIVILECAKELK